MLKNISRRTCFVPRPKPRTYEPSSLRGKWGPMAKALKGKNEERTRRVSRSRSSIYGVPKKKERATDEAFVSHITVVNWKKKSIRMRKNPAQCKGTGKLFSFFFFCSSFFRDALTIISSPFSFSFSFFALGTPTTHTARRSGRFCEFWRAKLSAPSRVGISGSLGYPSK